MQLFSDHPYYSGPWLRLDNNVWVLTESLVVAEFETLLNCIFDLASIVEIIYLPHFKSWKLFTFLLYLLLTLDRIRFTCFVSSAVLTLTRRKEERRKRRITTCCSSYTYSYLNYSRFTSDSNHNCLCLYKSRLQTIRNICSNASCDNSRFTLEAQVPKW